MSLLNYDKAVYSKVLGIYDEVIFASPDEAFKTNASKHDGRVLMPFISVWRLPEFSINRITYNDTRVRLGDTMRMTDNNKRRSAGVPVALTYQIDIYSNKRSTCDGIAAELLLHLLQTPYVDVFFDFDGVSMTHQFEFTVTDNVTDNTNISDFEDTGRIYRLTIEIILNDAIIYKVDRFDSKLVEKVLVDIRDIKLGELYDHFEVELEEQE
jgi:hypothetical protein